MPPPRGSLLPLPAEPALPPSLPPHTRGAPGVLEDRPSPFLLFSKSRCKGRPASFLKLINQNLSATEGVHLYNSLQGFRCTRSSSCGFLLLQVCPVRSGKSHTYSMSVSLAQGGCPSARCDLCPAPPKHTCGRVSRLRTPGHAPQALPSLFKTPLWSRRFLSSGPCSGCRRPRPRIIIKLPVSST